MTQVPAFPSKTNLKLDISITPKMNNKVIVNLDPSIISVVSNVFEKRIIIGLLIT